MRGAVGGTANALLVKAAVAMSAAVAHEVGVAVRRVAARLAWWRAVDAGLRDRLADGRGSDGDARRWVWEVDGDARWLVTMGGSDSDGGAAATSGDAIAGRKRRRDEAADAPPPPPPEVRRLSSGNGVVVVARPLDDVAHVRRWHVSADAAPMFTVLATAEPAADDVVVDTRAGAGVVAR